MFHAQVLLVSSFVKMYASLYTVQWLRKNPIYFLLWGINFER